MRKQLLILVVAFGGTAACGSPDTATPEATSTSAEALSQCVTATVKGLDV